MDNKAQEMTIVNVDTTSMSTIKNMSINTSLSTRLHTTITGLHRSTEGHHAIIWLLTQSCWQELAMRTL